MYDNSGGIRSKVRIHVRNSSGFDERKRCTNKITYRESEELTHTHTKIDTVNKLSVAISFKLISGIQIRGNCAGKYQDWIC